MQGDKRDSSESVGDPLLMALNTIVTLRNAFMDRLVAEGLEATDGEQAMFDSAKAIADRLRKEVVGGNLMASEASGS